MMCSCSVAPLRTMSRNIEAVPADPRSVSQRVAALGFRAARSQTNFFFIDVGWDNRAARDHFLSTGIIIKPWKEAGYETFSRLRRARSGQNRQAIST